MKVNCKYKFYGLEAARKNVILYYFVKQRIAAKIANITNRNASYDRN